MAKEKGINSTQLAIAWVIAKGHVPIPGAKRPKYIDQNIAAAKVELTQDELNRLE